MSYKNMDDAMSSFFENELRQVMARSYDVVYPELMARTLFPVSSEINPGAESFVYDQYDFVGVAKLIHSYASDLPSVEVTGKQFVRRIWSEGISFKYSFQDVRAAQFAGRNLNDRKAKAARRQMLALENKIAFHGDEEAGIPGFIDYPNILTENVTAKWDDKDAIINTLTAAISKQRKLTHGAEAANVLLVPDDYYVMMATTRYNEFNDSTLLEYIVNKFPFITEVVEVEFGEGAGFGQDQFPSIIYGPPLGAGPNSGSLDVVSLGMNGFIIVDFDQMIVDGDGPDLIVFENVFIGWYETGIVSASMDGETWFTWDCDTEDSDNGYPGCAGASPSLSHPNNCIDAREPELAGGDAFDLADIGLSEARYIRIADSGASGPGGFDLDAIAIVNGIPE